MVESKTLLEKEEEEKKDEKWVLKTSVWWHINSCPIPNDIDLRLVGTRIKSAVNSTRWSSDHFTITAVGDLKDSPGDDVLQVLSSTGISLVHTKKIQAELTSWICTNEPPATMMVICGPSELESLARSLYSILERNYTVLLAYPQRTRTPDLEWLWKSFLRDIPDQWLWETLLKGDDKQVTEAGEMDVPSFFCSLCDSTQQSFDGFTKHLKCDEKHAYLERSMGPPKGNSVFTQRWSGRGPFRPIDFASLIAEEMRLKRKPEDDLMKPEEELMKPEED